MSIVKSVTTHDDYANGSKRERRYKVTITNNDGVDEIYILSPVIVDVSDDGSIYGDQKLASLADVEVGHYISSVEYGTSVDFTAGRFNTTGKLFKAVALKAFKATRESQIRLNFLPYLAQATDTQLKNLLNRTQAQVDNIRTKAAQLQAIKDKEDLYTEGDI